MAIVYAVGDALVGKDEIDAKLASGKLQQFQRDLVNNPDDASIQFLSGTANARNILDSLVRKTGPPIDFEPIGIGKPLTVQIRHVYTGNKAEGYWGTNDMLVASAIKSIATYDAAPRAVNYLVSKATNNRNFRTIDATEKGTPLVYYSPSLAQHSSSVTVEVMFSSFPKETFDAMSQAFSASSGIPVFAPVSGYLVAAGMVTKLLGNIGKSLSDGTPALRQTEEITFITPGSYQPIAQFLLLISDEVPQELFTSYRVTNRGVLARVDDENKLYDGEYPYVVISLDGRPVDEYKSFTQAAASAAQLDKFYNINDGSSQPLTALGEALKLYNDMKFRDKAINLAKSLKESDKNSEDYKNKLNLYNAYVKNIGTKDLAPPDLS